MENLENWTKKNTVGRLSTTAQYSPRRFVLNNPDAKEIFLKVAKDAQEKHISDTIAAQYLVDNYVQFSHLHYNTVRRYFRDFRNGRIK